MAKITYQVISQRVVELYENFTVEVPDDLDPKSLSVSNHVGQTIFDSHEFFQDIEEGHEFFEANVIDLTPQAETTKITWPEGGWGVSP